MWNFHPVTLGSPSRRMAMARGVGFQELPSVVVDVNNKSPSWRLLLSSLHTCSFRSANTFDYVQNATCLRKTTICCTLFCKLSAPDPKYSTMYPVHLVKWQKTTTSLFASLHPEAEPSPVTAETPLHVKRTSNNQPMSQHFWPQICCHWMEKFPQQFLLYGLDFFLCPSPDQGCFIW